MLQEGPALSRVYPVPPEIYHEHEPKHAFYREMCEEMVRESKTHCGNLAEDGIKPRILEFGVGTGNFTLYFHRSEPDCHYAVIDIDTPSRDFRQGIFSIAGINPSDELKSILELDGVETEDIVISAFAHDHIQDQRALVQKIQSILKPGGRYIVGLECLRAFDPDDESDMIAALQAWHGYVIDRALTEGHNELAWLEAIAARSGIEKKGDFKVTPKMLCETMELAGLRLISGKKIGPSDFDDIGGIYVFVFEKPNFSA